MYGLNTKAQGKMYAGTFMILLDIFGTVPEIYMLVSLNKHSFLSLLPSSYYYDIIIIVEVGAPLGDNDDNDDDHNDY